MSSMRVFSKVMTPAGTHCAVEWMEEGNPRSVVEAKRLLEKVEVGETCSVKVMERSKPVVYEAKLLGYGSKREMTEMLEREEDCDEMYGDAEREFQEDVVEELHEDIEKEFEDHDEFDPRPVTNTKKRGRKPRSSNKQPSAKKQAEMKRQAEADRVTALLLDGLSTTPPPGTPERQLPLAPIHQSTPCMNNALLEMTSGPDRETVQRDRAVRETQQTDTANRVTQQKDRADRVTELRDGADRVIQQTDRQRDRAEVTEMQQHSVVEGPQANARSLDLFDSDEDDYFDRPAKRPRLDNTPRTSFQIAGGCGDVQPYVLIAELKEMMYSQFGELNRKIEKLNDSFVELKTLISKKKQQHRTQTQQSAASNTTITPDADDVELQEDNGEDPLTVCCGNPKVPGKHVYLKVASEAALADFRQNSSCIAKDPAKFALKLLSVFFTDKDLSESNCTRADGRKMLDPDILLGIRYHVNFKYPVTSAEEARRWQTIVIKNLNTKCRATRRKLILKSGPSTETGSS